MDEDYGATDLTEGLQESKKNSSPPVMRPGTSIFIVHESNECLSLWANDES